MIWPFTNIFFDNTQFNGKYFKNEMLKNNNLARQLQIDIDSEFFAHWVKTLSFFKKNKNWFAKSKINLNDNSDDLVDTILRKIKIIFFFQKINRKFFCMILFKIKKF